MFLSRFTDDGGFTRFGTVYFRARDEIKGLRRYNPWFRVRHVEKRLSFLEGRYRAQLPRDERGLPRVR